MKAIHYLTVALQQIIKGSKPKKTFIFSWHARLAGGRSLAKNITAKIKSKIVINISSLYYKSTHIKVTPSKLKI